MTVVIKETKDGYYCDNTVRNKVLRGIAILCGIICLGFAVLCILNC
ncbi:MAG: hypothetical protein PHG05_02260 [Candidatus Nanoarchaeia archaeon]|nr:hypothetical protein [Candidatus Nanoarchaeia archaeon]